MSSARIFMGLALCAALVGCDQPARERPPRAAAIVPRWDPELPVVPTPTDLVRNPATGRLDVPIGGHVPPVEAELYRYLNTLQAWPTAIAAEVVFAKQGEATGAALDPSSIDEETVLVLALNPDGDGGSTPLAAARVLSADGQKLSLQPDGGAWPAGTTVLVAVRGGDAGVRGAAGEPVLSDVVFWFMKSPVPLDGSWRTLPADSPEEKQALAKRLEEARLQHQPYFAAVEARGWSREDVAVLWAFTTDRLRPELTYDPAKLQLPFPNDLAFDPGGGGISVPPDPADDADVAAIKRGLEGKRGFSRSGTVSFFANAKIDPSSLSEQSVRVFALGAEGPREVGGLRRALHPDGRTVLVDPVGDGGVRGPLSAKTTHLVVATSGLRALTGEPLAEAPVQAVLKFRSPLFEGGRSTLFVLPDADAARAEPVRRKLDEALTALEGRGLLRDDVKLAFTFTTHDPSDVTGPLSRAAAEGQGSAAPTLRSRQIPLLTPGVVLPMLNTRSIVFGTLPSPNRIDPVSREFSSASARVEDVPFALCLPNASTTSAKTKVVLVGHALTTSKESLVLFCDPLSQAGFATLAIDLPFHGERSFCVDASHCNSPDTCSRDGTCRNASGAKTALRTQTFEWSQSFQIPAATGLAFLDDGSLFATRDHLQQSVIDLTAALRSLRTADWAAVTGGYPLDGERVSYLGISLGALLGPDLAAVDPSVKAFVLNAGGADLFGIAEDSPRIGPEFRARLTARGLEAGTPRYLLFQQAARWIFEEGDPIHLGGSLTGRRFLLQAADNDKAFPRQNTLALSAVLDAGVQWYSPGEKQDVGGHGFFLDPLDAEGTRARTDAVNFLSQP